jgi:hypothetical protein
VRTTAVGRNGTLEDVILHVKELEERVAALERLAGEAAPQPVTAASPVAATPVGFSFTGGAFATVAKVLLGFAGAYLLRAIAESGFVAPSIGIAAGLVYAVFWLIWSTRLRDEDRFDSHLYSLTAALIFSGLLWENSVATHLLPGAVGASMIVAFSYGGLWAAWRRSLAGIAAIMSVAGASIALLLLIATHDVVPFAAALLAIAAGCELAACRDKWLGHRWFPALAADLGVLIVAWVITRPQGVPESYRPFGMSSVVALEILLVLVYVLSFAWRTLASGHDTTKFEITQNVAGIALLLWGSVVMGREAPAARMVVEGFCLLAGMGCYAIAVLFLARQSRERNFLMYGIFGLALVMAGISILFSGIPLVMVWCTLAVVAAWLGTHEHRISLQLHAPVFLSAAAMGSGLVEFARQALHGSSAPSGSRLLEIVVTAIALGLCYWMAGEGENGRARFPALWIAALLCWAILGLVGAGITNLLGPDSMIINTLRTGLICAVALVLTRLSVRRPELQWLLYPLMLYGAYRLLTEDFPRGRPTALALSLLFYGGTLLLLTRMVRGSTPP